MCLIIDANCAALTLTANPSVAFEPVINSIMSNKTVMVRGGTTLANEYLKINSVWKFILALDKAGKSITVSTASVDKIEKQLIADGKLCSNDAHIIALAQVSGARVLCSHDQNLHTDFCDKKLLDNPRGNVYQSNKHTKLLKKCIHQNK